MLGHRQQNAPDMQSGVDFALHAGNRICQLRHTNHRERLRLHRDDDLVGSGQRICQQKPHGGGAVNDAVIILAAVLFQTGFQQNLAAHHGAHCQLKAGQPEIGWNEIHLWCRVIRALALINALSVGEGLFIGNLHQKLCDCLFKILLRRDTAVAGQIALRVKVHHEDAVALLGKGNAQVIRGSRFARTALLVCDSNSFHLVSSCKISSKLIQCFWYSCVTCTSVSL